MDQLLEAIRNAVAADATDEMRETGANACRTILVALEARPGEPLAPPTTLPTDTSPIATIAAGLRGVPVDQLLDLAISKLRTLVPAEVAPTVPRISIPLIQVPRR